MPLSDPLSVVKILTDIFETIKIQYLIGGSLASSLHGIPRATQDVDVVADLKTNQTYKFIESLKTSFFIDEELIKTSIKKRETFNIIDKEYLFKIDIFLQGIDGTSKEEMQRRVLYQIPGTNGQQIYVSSPEDIIAHKLFWYKLGNNISERQWNDAANVLKVQNDKLDFEYLKKVCIARDVFDLYEKLLKESK